MPFKPNWDEDLAKKATVKHKVPVQELVQFHEKRVKHLAEDLFVETLPEIGYGSELREEDYDVQSGTPFFPSGIFTMKGQDVLYLVGLEKIVSKLSRDKKCNQPLENMQCHFCFTDFSPTWGRLEEEDDEKIVCEGTALKSDKTRISSIARIVFTRN